MATNLIETVKSFFTPEVVDRASARLGESPDGIRKAVNGGVPMVFAGILYRSERGEAESLLGDVHQAATYQLPQGAGTLFNNTSTDMASGNGWGSSLFGGAFTVVSNALASFAGIKTGSAKTMLNLMTPLSLGVVGNHAYDNELNAWGLKTYLDTQKPTIMAALPAGISMGSLFEDSYHPGGIHTIEGHEPAVGSAERPLRVVPYTIWWVLLVLAILGIIAYFIGS